MTTAFDTTDKVRIECTFCEGRRWMELVEWQGYEKNGTMLNCYHCGCAAGADVWRLRRAPWVRLAWSA